MTDLLIDGAMVFDGEAFDIWLARDGGEIFHLAESRESHRFYQITEDDYFGFIDDSNEYRVAEWMASEEGTDR